jgi:UDP-N-acetylglucosamine 3-dehydrogenase
MTRTVLRAGLVGLGSMGRHHARVLSSLPGVDFVGVADPAGDPAGLAQGARVVPSVDDLIALDVDYAVVAAPTNLHESIGLSFADAGVHVLIEKPVAADSNSGRILAERFERAGLVGAVGHIERFNPAVRQLEMRLAAGDLGDIYQVATRRQGPFPARIADVGVILDLATHDIDLTGFVTGLQFRSVSAHTAHKSGREHEDLVAVVGVLEGGVVTSHLVNWLSPMKERLTVVTGERGTFVADTLAADLTFYANGTVSNDWADIAHFRGMSEGNVTRFAFSKTEPLRTEHECFRDAVLGLESSVVTLRRGLEAVLVAEAVLGSARSGLTVHITPDVDKGEASAADRRAVPRSDGLYLPGLSMPVSAKADVL